MLHIIVCQTWKNCYVAIGIAITLKSRKVASDRRNFSHVLRKNSWPNLMKPGDSIFRISDASNVLENTLVMHGRCNSRSRMRIRYPVPVPVPVKPVNSSEFQSIQRPVQTRCKRKVRRKKRIVCKVS